MAPPDWDGIQVFAAAPHYAGCRHILRIIAYKWVCTSRYTVLIDTCSYIGIYKDGYMFSSGSARSGDHETSTVIILQNAFFDQCPPRNEFRTKRVFIFLNSCRIVCLAGKCCPRDSHMYLTVGQET